MTKDELTKLIHDNELFHGTVGIGLVMDMSHIEKFAALVAAAEREAIAKFMLSVDLSGLKNDPALQHYTANLLIHNAKAIRARGQE